MDERALERNEFDVLGAPVFAKGYLRKYAQLVHVNSDDVLAELAGHIYTIEIIDTLGHRAMEDLERLGYDNVEVRIGGLQIGESDYWLNKYIINPENGGDAPGTDVPGYLPSSLRD